MQIKEFISKEKIKEKVKELALQIKKDYGDNVYCLIVLTGAIVFFKDLRRALEKEGVNVDFTAVKVSSYEGTESTGKLNYELRISKRVKGKDVLVVEDIIDTGLTLNVLKKDLIDSGAESVKICALLDKKDKRKFDVKIDYNGFVIPDKFIVGYGLDYEGMHRDLDFIGVLS